MLNELLGALVMGLSWSWWKKKHQQHHIFTNNDALDHDIRHKYRTMVFPLLLIKWRLDSLWFILSHLKLVPSLLLSTK